MALDNPVDEEEQVETKIKRPMAAITPLAFALIMVFAGTASAALVMDIGGSAVKPNKAGAASTLYFEGTLVDDTGVKPPPIKRFFIEFPPGGKVNPKAASICNLTKLTNTGRCPTSSKIGSGTSTVNVSFGGFGILTARLTIYNIKRQPGEKAAFVVYAVEPQSGVIAQVMGHVVPAQIIKGGLRLEMNDLDKQVPEILGIKPAIIGMKAKTGKKKTTYVKKRIRSKKRKGKKRKRRRYKRVKRVVSYITNPKTCNGTWTSYGEFHFLDGQVLTGNFSVPCRK